jgi:hypothetical protein
MVFVISCHDQMQILHYIHSHYRLLCIYDRRSMMTTSLSHVTGPLNVCVWCGNMSVLSECAVVLSCRPALFRQPLVANSNTCDVGCGIYACGTSFVLPAVCDILVFCSVYLTRYPVARQCICQTYWDFIPDIEDVTIYHVQKGWTEQHIPSKLWYSHTKLHGVMTQTTTVWNYTPIKTSNYNKRGNVRTT